MVKGGEVDVYRLSCVPVMVSLTCCLLWDVYRLSCVPVMVSLTCCLLWAVFRNQKLLQD
jgi:hypothetical protein